MVCGVKSVVLRDEEGLLNSRASETVMQGKARPFSKPYKESPPLSKQGRMLPKPAWRRE